MDGRLYTALQDNGGFITVAQGKEAGLSHTALQRAVNAGYIERVARGVYGSVEEMNDVLYVKQLQRPKAIYSHGTALYLHDLTDRDPLTLSVTVPTGYNTKQLVLEHYKVFSVKRELYNWGCVEMQTKYDHPVMTYNMERTICDCIRSRGKLDAEIVTEALKRYARRTDRDIHALMEMADKFRVKKILRTYMEVLV